MAKREVRYGVKGMSCSACSSKIALALQALPGVVEAEVSLAGNEAVVLLNEGVRECVGVRDMAKAVEALGYGCRYLKDAGRGAGAGAGKEEVDAWFSLLCLALVFGVPVLVLHLSMSYFESLMMMLDTPVACSGALNMEQVTMLVLNTPIQFGVGYRFYRGAVLGAMHGSYGMDCLVVVGTSLTFFYSLGCVFISCHTGISNSHMFFEVSGMLLMFVTIGKYVEAYAKGNTATAVSSLLNLQPQQVKHMIIYVNIFLCVCVFVCSIVVIHFFSLLRRPQPFPQPLFLHIRVYFRLMVFISRPS